MVRILDALFAFCASLKLAVFTILALALFLGVATFYEARYGPVAVQELIYGSNLFLAVMAALAINVMAAALIRYPWKRKQTGFVVTHLGILLLLAGCLISFRFSVDGMQALQPGQTAKDIGLNRERLQISINDNGADKNYSVPVHLWHEAGYPTAAEALSFRWGEPGWRGRTVGYDLAPGVKAEVLEWLPAAKLVRELRADPAGTPHVQLEIGGTTPNGMPVSQSLTLAIPKGDAGVTQQVFGNVLETALWTTSSPREVKDFLSPPDPKSLGERGMLSLRVGENVATVPVGKDGDITSLPGGGSVTILQYFPQAEARGTTLEKSGEDPVKPVVRVRIIDPTATPREFIVAARDPYLVMQTAGQPMSQLSLRYDHPAMYARTPDGTRGRLHLLQGPDNKLYFRVYAGDGVRSCGEVKLGQPTAKWMGFTATVTKHLPAGKLVEEYQQAFVAPSKLNGSMRAMRVALTVDGDRHEVWLARAAVGKGFQTPRGQATVAYGFEALDLPFSVSLLDAKRTNNPGTSEAAAYESDVIVTKPAGEKTRAAITMNQPLTIDGYTFYQAEFDDSLGTPVTTLGIRKDPGTLLKYLGSATICFGIFLMFYMKAYFQKPGPSPATSAAPMAAAQPEREFIGGAA